MEKKKNLRKHDRWQTVIMCLCAIALLALVYIFQRVNFFSLVFGGHHPYIAFIVNKTLRLVLNDFACFVLIYALFKERKFLKIAFVLFLTELLVILPFYFLVKLSLEGDSEISSPLLSQIHRLIVNPTLMILLIIGFFYQRWASAKK